MLNSLHAAIGLPAHAKADKQLVDTLDKVQLIDRRPWNITDASLADSKAGGDDSKMLEESAGYCLEAEGRSVVRPTDEGMTEINIVKL